MQPPGTHPVLQMDELIDCSDALSIYMWHSLLCLLHNNERSRAAAGGSSVTFQLTHLLPFLSISLLSVCMSACEGCVCVTWTDSDEMNSSER